jgi:AAA family ATP:ADP antiporter
METTTKKQSHLQMFLSGLDQFERLKFFILAFSFSATIGIYSILRSLKTSIFISMVGVEYQPWTKMIMLVLIVPIMYFYSKVVDRFRVDGVARFWFTAYAGICILLGLLLLHPVYGLSNTSIGAHRYVGWFCYIVIETYSALILSTIWAFINAINTPTSAAKGYGIINASGRVAGLITASCSGALFALSSVHERIMIPSMMIGCGVVLIMTAFAISYCMKKIPAEYVRGYAEAHEHKKTEKQARVGLLSGIRLLFTQPYVFGIFWIVFATELITGIFDYQMNVLLAEHYHSSAREMSIFMFAYTASFQACGLLLSLGGIRQLLQKIGVQRCLLITPVVAIFLAILLPFNRSLILVFTMLVILRALVYGFNVPVQEMLYIPTVKDIQFKSRSWIASFGRTISKTSSSTVNLLSQCGSNVAMAGGIVSLFIAASWTIVAFALGRMYQKTIDRDGLIGED